MVLDASELLCVCVLLLLQRAVGLLLRRGAEANARDKFWQTPLHVAAANRATRCAEALLTHLSNLNMADRTGRTALHHAAQSGFQEVRTQTFVACGWKEIGGRVPLKPVDLSLRW